MLSIIIPVYNVESFLRVCIISILNQDYSDIEVLLIDDGSTDSSGSICDHFQKRDSRIQVYHTKNLGVGNARNLGIEKAKGEYITFVDSDDYVSPDIYKANIGLLDSDNSIDIVQIPLVGKKNQRRIIEGKKNLFDMWIFQNKIITNYFWDKIFRRHILENLRFPTNMRYEDRFLFSDVLCAINKLYISDKGGYHYRNHSGQLTKQCNVGLKLDMIKANIHTLGNIPIDFKGAYIRCYWGTIVLLKEIPSEEIEQSVICEIKKMFPSIKTIWLSNVPLGIKLQLTKKKLVGHIF